MAESLKGLKCSDCGAGPFMKPLMGCRKCGSLNLTETELSGKGKIHTFTNIETAFGDMKDKTPYCLGIVELAEGPKVITIVEDVDIQAVKVDLPVKFKYNNVEGIPMFTGAV